MFCGGDFCGMLLLLSGFDDGKSREGAHEVEQPYLGKASISFPTIFHSKRID
jgi:hypothetical protein